MDRAYRSSVTTGNHTIVSRYWTLRTCKLLIHVETCFFQFLLFWFELLLHRWEHSSQLRRPWLWFNQSNGKLWFLWFLGFAFAFNQNCTKRPIQNLKIKTDLCRKETFFLNKLELIKYPLKVGKSEFSVLLLIPILSLMMTETKQIYKTFISICKIDVIPKINNVSYWSTDLWLMQWSLSPAML